METSERVVVCVDAMGGDDAPQAVLAGVELALSHDEEIEIVLTGPADIIEPFAAAHERVSVVATTQVIAMGEHPAQAVRAKKDSSIVVGCRLVHEGRAQGFFSAGSTGACLTAATLVMGRIKGITRPALATVIPSPVHPVILTDVGANADCKPEFLVQFAKMGTVYARIALGVKNPRVALVNIGAEETKGNNLAFEAYGMLKDELDNFAGNAEGDDILAATHDVFVTDGFTGNVMLKTIEGTSKALFSSIKGILKASAISKLAALTLKSGLKELMGKVNPDAFGGAPLLGVRGVCIIGHGHSNPNAIENGIRATAQAVRANLVDSIEALVLDSTFE